LKDAEISTLTVSEIKGLADEGISIVDAIEGWERGKNIAAVRKAKDKLDDAAKKAQGLFEKEKDASANSRSVFNSALEFTRAFETWSSEPHTTLTTKAIAGVRAAIVISNKSLSNYK
jgi:exonuclease VII small subunit